MVLKLFIVCLFVLVLVFVLLFALPFSTLLSVLILARLPQGLGGHFGVFF